MAKDLSISILLDYYGNMLTEKQRTIMEHYYNNDLSLSEIAENEGITRQGVRDAVKRSESMLLELEENLRFVASFKLLQKELDRIKKACNEIAEFNLRYGCSKEINEKSREIYDIAEKLMK